ncbi:peptidoglycan DD-metalloendopeptidase family protein [Flavonifractor sp. An112]|uniref:peptidoglycan DD-metalloendopeptidase family protein n=1 Tax=Flavonifractor sp. An112 TaxID=1965544 RepID=UPI001748D46A|nr:peptidoglycan DD-metalloendopeptidase family protein [Flavonifractor sp. An112]HIZ92861.1 peptidoglycan DD-metalloendopeptidase family protein [Candidatus Flavonifractor avicola]
MKKSFYHRFSDFIEGKGFYIVLALCLAAIGLSGWFLFSSLTGEQEEQPVGGTASITVTPAPTPVATVTPVKPTVTATPRPTATVPAVAATPSATVQPTPTPKSAPTSLTWPVQGEVLTNYSVETLAYDVTMADWRTHAGVDIAAAAGTEVRAPASGVVVEVTEDVMLGTTVVIDHGGDLTTTCANLASVPTVEVGDEVTVGDIIGSVGNTAIAESALASHLHFSVEREGQSVDPMELLNG